MRPSEANCCGEDGQPGAIGLEQGEKVGTLLEGTINDSKASPKLSCVDCEVWFPGIGRGGDGGYSSIGDKSDARPSSCSPCECTLAGRDGMAMTSAALSFLL